MHPSPLDAGLPTSGGRGIAPVMHTHAAINPGNSAASADEPGALRRAPPRAVPGSGDSGDLESSPVALAIMIDRAEAPVFSQLQTCGRAIAH